jgi:hypothetical protein
MALTSRNDAAMDSNDATRKSKTAPRSPAKVYGKRQNRSLEFTPRKRRLIETQSSEEQRLPAVENDENDELNGSQVEDGNGSFSTQQLRAIREGQLQSRDQNQVGQREEAADAHNNQQEGSSIDLDTVQQAAYAAATHADHSLKSPEQLWQKIPEDTQPDTLDTQALRRLRKDALGETQASGIDSLDTQALRQLQEEILADSPEEFGNTSAGLERGNSSFRAGNTQLSLHETQISNIVDFGFSPETRRTGSERAGPVDGTDEQRIAHHIATATTSIRHGESAKEHGASSTATFKHPSVIAPNKHKVMENYVPPPPDSQDTTTQEHESVYQKSFISEAGSSPGLGRKHAISSYHEDEAPIPSSFVESQDQGPANFPQPILDHDDDSHDSRSIFPTTPAARPRIGNSKGLLAPDQLFAQTQSSPPDPAVLASGGTNRPSPGFFMTPGLPTTAATTRFKDPPTTSRLRFQGFASQSSDVGETPSTINRQPSDVQEAETPAPKPRSLPATMAADHQWQPEPIPYKTREQSQQERERRRQEFEPSQDDSFDPDFNSLSDRRREREHRRKVETDAVVKRVADQIEASERAERERRERSTRRTVSVERLDVVVPASGEASTSSGSGASRSKPNAYGNIDDDQSTFGEVSHRDVEGDTIMEDGDDEDGRIADSQRRSQPDSPSLPGGAPAQHITSENSAARAVILPTAPLPTSPLARRPEVAELSSQLPSLRHTESQSSQPEPAEPSRVPSGRVPKTSSGEFLKSSNHPQLDTTGSKSDAVVPETSPIKSHKLFSPAATPVSSQALDLHGIGFTQDDPEYEQLMNSHGGSPTQPASLPSYPHSGHAVSQAAFSLRHESGAAIVGSPADGRRLSQLATSGVLHFEKIETRRVGLATIHSDGSDDFPGSSSPVRPANRRIARNSQAPLKSAMKNVSDMQPQHQHGTRRSSTPPVLYSASSSDGHIPDTQGADHPGVSSLLDDGEPEPCFLFMQGLACGMEGTTKHVHSLEMREAYLAAKRPKADAHISSSDPSLGFQEAIASSQARPSNTGNGLKTPLQSSNAGRQTLQPSVYATAPTGPQSTSRSRSSSSSSLSSLNSSQFANQFNNADNFNFPGTDRSSSASRAATPTPFTMPPMVMDDDMIETTMTTIDPKKLSKKQKTFKKHRSVLGETNARSSPPQAPSVKTAEPTPAPDADNEATASENDTAAVNHDIEAGVVVRRARKSKKPAAADEVPDEDEDQQVDDIDENGEESADVSDARKATTAKRLPHKSSSRPTRAAAPKRLVEASTDSEAEDDDAVANRGSIIKPGLPHSPKTEIKYAANRNLFKNMAFMVSFTNEMPNLKKTREYVEKLIRVHDGEILSDGCQELFTHGPNDDVSSAVPASTSTRSGRNRSSTPESNRGLLKDMRLTARAKKLGFVAFVGNTFMRKSKYAQVLAFGLPALNYRWIEMCVKKNDIVDYSPYLLAAGESNYLGGAIRSRDLTIYHPNDTESQFANVIARRKKLLAGQKVMFFAGKTNAEQLGKKQYLFLTRALGAEVVQQVKDVNDAKKVLKTDDAWDIIYVMDEKKKKDTLRELLTPVSEKKSGKGKRKRTVSPDLGELHLSKKPKVVGDEYVMQSLILGTLYDEEDL